MTRGRSENLAVVVTDEPTLDSARDVLEATLAVDLADVPAVRHRQQVQPNRATSLLTPTPAFRHPRGADLSIGF